MVVATVATVVAVVATAVIVVAVVAINNPPAVKHPEPHALGAH